MPELPEVETIVHEMNESGLIGTKIVKAQVFWPRSIASHSGEKFCEEIGHQTILQINRSGKYLVFKLSTHTLLVHLRMTGKFLFGTTKDMPVTPHERVRLYLSDGRILRFEDQRKFGKWNLLLDAVKTLDTLGIEPLSPEFTLEALHGLIKKHHRIIKPFLLDQKYIAGLGNIYVDEALWEAKIHPLKLTSSLTKKEIEALHQAIPKVLQKGINNIGTSLGAARANYFSLSGRRGSNQYQLNVFRRDGDPCPRCQTTLVKTVVAQRGTHFCPHCQKLR